MSNVFSNQSTSICRHVDNASRPNTEICHNLTEELENIPGKEWIDKLKYAFREADIHKNNRVHIKSWINSRLRFVISDRLLSDQEMEDFFYKIDSDLDGYISFEEIENYLISHQGSVTQMDITKVIQLTYNAPSAEIALASRIRTTKNDKCLKIMFIPATIQILTLSEKEFTIWEPSTCTPIQKVCSDHGKYVDFCFIQSLFKVAIAKENRQIEFFDIRKSQKIDFFISASLDSQKILRMSLSESYDALRQISKRRVPLFNSPTSISSDPKFSIIFIGDDSGRIEVFDIHRARRSKVGYGFQRLAVGRSLHTSTVSQIKYLDAFEAFVSTSYDGSIQTWTFDMKTKTFIIQYTFHDPIKLPILGFDFDDRTRDLIYTTSKHYISTWRFKTRHHTSVATPSIVSAHSVYRSEENGSYLITISKDNFFTSYQMPSFEQSRNWFIGRHHEFCPPTASLVVGEDLYLFGGYLSAWRIEIGDEDIVDLHSGPLVSALMNDDMRQIITVDQRGNQIQWDAMSGIKQFKSSLIVNNKILVNCVSMDLQKKRFGIGFSNGAFQIQSVNSGTILCEVDCQYCKGGCYSIEFGIFFGEPRVVCCTGARSVVLFDDIVGNRLRFSRNFIGHTENVMRTTIIKERILLTIGTGREIFLWSVTQQNPVSKLELKGDPTSALDLPSDPDVFVVGDVMGYLYFVSLKSFSILSVLNAFDMVRKTSISYVTLIDELGLFIAGNFKGYVKFWTMDGGKMKETRVFRAHTQSIVSIIYSKCLNCLVSLGRDMETRLWSLNEPFCLIGELNKQKKWSIDNRDSWLGDVNIEFNQKDFKDNRINKMDNKDQIKVIRSMKSSINLQNIADLKKIEENKPEFSLDAFMECMKQADGQLQSGRIIIKKQNTLNSLNYDSIKMNSKKLPQKNLRFDALITKRGLNKSYRFVAKVREEISAILNNEESLPVIHT